MFLKLLENRRSIRKYTSQAVGPETVDGLVEAALRSPSSMGSQPWEFIVVTQKDLLSDLARAKPHGATFLKDAPLGIVVCAAPSRSSVWVEDASIAATILHLAAASMGLGSCWIQIRERMHDENRTAGSFVAEVLGMPEELAVEAIVAVGYPAESKRPHAKGTLPYHRVHRERYGRLFSDGPGHVRD